MKTGGLADVAHSLPASIHSMGADIRIIMPNYGSLNIADCDCQVVAQFEVNQDHVRLITTCIPGTSVPVILVDCPELFAREGNPYLNSEGAPWSDNVQRFGLFSKVISLVAQNQAGISWSPTLIHCNDWQTGLALALLRNEGVDKGLVFTIHNIAYQGIFSYEDFQSLNLPDKLWSVESLEYYEQMCFLKGGITSCNQLNTVSPRFAEEIQTTEYGFGMDGLLRTISDKLSGIINGVDIKEWSPQNDKYLTYNYDTDHLEAKAKNKLELQQRFNFIADENIPLFASVTRLVEQKGIDLIIKIIEKLLALNVQVIMLGNGDEEIENKLLEIARLNENKFHVIIGYDEILAHKITAAADIYLMPSRFEPCGLNQMYSQIYGAVPIVRNTGGLSDTVENYNGELKAENSATGFVFENSKPDELFEAITRALDCYSNKQLWRQIQLNAMKKDYSWQSSARQYLKIYEEALR
jgi:starch synthase